jgi:hypothetical protein
VIRECGRLDVKNPLEEKIFEMNFSFAWVGKKEVEH